MTHAPCTGFSVEPPIAQMHTSLDHPPIGLAANGKPPTRISAVERCILDTACHLPLALAVLDTRYRARRQPHVSNLCPIYRQICPSTRTDAAAPKLRWLWLFQRYRKTAVDDDTVMAARKPLGVNKLATIALRYRGSPSLTQSVNDYCVGAWMLLARTTSPQRTISRCNSACAAWGERCAFGYGETPVSAHALTIAGSSITPCSTALSFSMIGRGVPEGANSACQYEISSLGPSTCTMLG